MDCEYKLDWVAGLIIRLRLGSWIENRSEFG